VLAAVQGWQEEAVSAPAQTGSCRSENLEPRDRCAGNSATDPSGFGRGPEEELSVALRFPKKTRQIEGKKYAFMIAKEGF
jgi:hypothetical protein